MITIYLPIQHSQGPLIQGIMLRIHCSIMKKIIRFAIIIIY